MNPLRRSATCFVAALVLVVAGCGDDGGGASTGDSTGDVGEEVALPVTSVCRASGAYDETQVEWQVDDTASSYRIWRRALPPADATALMQAWFAWDAERVRDEREGRGDTRVATADYLASFFAEGDQELVDEVASSPLVVGADPAYTVIYTVEALRLGEPRWLCNPVEVQAPIAGLEAPRVVPGDGLVMVLLDGGPYDAWTTQAKSLEIYRDGALIDTVTAPPPGEPVEYFDFGVSNGVDGAYTVARIDLVGERSPQTPPASGAARSWVALEAAFDHACALSAAGEAWCFGSDRSGQLGAGSRDADRYTPEVEGLVRAEVAPGEPLTGVAELAVSELSTCAALADGGVSCWGEALEGQRGFASDTWTSWDGACCALDAETAGGNPLCGDTTCADGTRVFEDTLDLCCQGAATTRDRVVRTRPAAIPGLADVAHVDSGLAHACVVTNAGGVHCWGSNRYGQLGLGPADLRRHAAPEPALLGGAPFDQVANVAAGADHTCAQRDDGSVWCWGDDGYGQLGQGLIVGQLPNATLIHGRGLAGEPLQVPGVTNVTALAAGGAATCALAPDAVTCWGRPWVTGSPGARRSDAVRYPLAELLEAGEEALALSVGALGDGERVVISTSFGRLLSNDGSPLVSSWGPVVNGRLTPPLTGTRLLATGRYATCIQNRDSLLVCEASCDGAHFGVGRGQPILPGGVGCAARHPLTVGINRVQEGATPWVIYAP